jgi:hypothetical protein
MSFRLSKRQAELRAIEVAKDFLSKCDLRGWNWEIVSAIPDSINPDMRGRKVPRRWKVAVQWSVPGRTVDGPGLISVDVDARSADFVAE